MVTAPSIQNSHRQAAWPRVPCMLDSTPAPTRAEKAFEIRFPQKRMAFLRVSSLLVYHLDRMSSTPGRKAASTKPRKNRVTTMPLKSCTTPLKVEMRPQMSMTILRYREGLSRPLMSMLEGICMRI